MSIRPDTANCGVSLLAAAQELKVRRGARRDLIEYTQFTLPRYEANWHHQYIAQILLSISYHRLTRVIILEPPRHGKSEQVCIRWPAHHLGNNQQDSFIISAYAQRLANTFSRAVRNVLQSPNSQRCWQVKFKTEAETNWQLEGKEDERDSMIAAGVGGPITGEGANFFIIDDPVKNAEQAYSITYRDKVDTWYQSVARTRLTGRAPAIVLSMTRWHEDDLAGRLLRLAVADKHADQWIVICLPATNNDGREAYVWDTRKSFDDRELIAPYSALWPSMYDEAYMDATEHSSGPVVWGSLFQQRPTSPLGTIIKKSWIHRYYHRDLPIKMESILQSWDMAFKKTDDSSFVVGQVWGVWRTKRFLLDQVRDRMGYVDTKRAIRALSAKWPNAHRKLIEAKANGPAIMDDLRDEVPGMIPVEKGVGESKEAQLSAASTEFEAGQVLSPHPDEEPWVLDWEDELTAAPKGLFWDQCDATAQAILDLRSSLVSNEVTTGYRQPLNKTTMGYQ